MASAKKDQFRWGDAADEDDGLDGVLPPAQTFGPDEKGIKIKIEWRINDDGQKCKITTKTRLRKQVKKLKPEVIRRRQLPKFGDAKGQTGSDNLTMVSTEEIFLERPGREAKKEEVPKAGLADLGNASLIVCRICGKKGDHWTSKCPYKDLAGQGIASDERAPDGDGPASSLPTAGGTKGAYVPPSLREGAGRGAGDSMKTRGRDDNSIRVTNLSEDTREADLQELFGAFGPISRVYVAFDRETGLSRGFAFINYVNREDALRAINKLDGYGYDNLILRVEWATPRTDRP